ncbi:exodeoxyribonuclease VII small subunit [Candidatus Uhrbacteria bacterium]|nr:exodeoxyribonuclease VII small subunit [Candidatus Uhrbacteria bacterium]
MTASKAEKKFNFGEAYQELEQIIGWFEREEVDLDEGLKKFERGLALAQKCKERLKEVENKVVEIKAKFGEIDGAANE